MRTILLLIILATLGITGCTKDTAIDSQKSRNSGKVISDSQYSSEKHENESDDGKNGNIVVMNLPDAVQRAIKTAYPAGKIDEASLGYEVIITRGGNKFEITLDTTGKVLSELKNNKEYDTTASEHSFEDEEK